MKKFGSLTHSLPRSGQKEFLLTNQYLSRQKDDENKEISNYGVLFDLC